MQLATVATVLSGRLGLDLVQHGAGQNGVAGQDGFHDQPQGSYGDVASWADRAEEVHIAPFHRAVHRPLQGLQVRDVDAVHVNAFFSQ